MNEVYIPSKARSDGCYTPRVLDKYNIKYILVVEPQDFDNYKKIFDSVISLDKNDMGLAYARNWIKNYSKQNNENYHWQLDDDIKDFQVRYNSRNIVVDPNKTFSLIEEYTSNYSNISISGLRDSVYAWTQESNLSFNKVIASAVFINNNTKVIWDKNIIEDMAYSLNFLINGYCTVIFNRFLYQKAPNNSIKGGQLSTNTKYEALQLNLVNKYPHAFKVSRNKKGKLSVRSSSYWRLFTQRPEK